MQFHTLYLQFARENKVDTSFVPKELRAAAKVQLCVLLKESVGIAHVQQIEYYARSLKYLLQRDCSIK